jgi:hypothetical protein
VSTEESAAPAVPIPGYLGLTERTIEVDWKAVAEHGPCVIVAPRSPAWIAGLRSGDFIVSINSISYDAFHRAPPTADTEFSIVVWRERVGKFTAFGRLGTIPKSHSQSSLILPLSQSGRPVDKKERPFFMQGYISKHRELKALDTRLLSLLLNYEGINGIYPRRATLAKDLHCSLSTIDRSVQRCKCAGVLQVDSGKTLRRSNRYYVTWPLSHPKSSDWF